MATRIYDTKTIELLDGTEVELKPLKIKYLHKVMEAFEDIHSAQNDYESMYVLAKCVYLCFLQLCPEKSGSLVEVEDNINMPIIHDVLDFCVGIKLKPSESEEEPIKNKAKDGGQTWKDLDLVKMESEVFILGIWKDFEELEANLSMPELANILSTKRELDYDEKKFLAALQGVDLDKNNKNSTNAWEEMKARVFSKGATSDPNDILSLQGVNAQKAGFGIGMGLDYEDSRDPNVMKN